MKILQRKLQPNESHKDNIGYDQWLDCEPTFGETPEQSKVALEAAYPEETYRIVVVQE